MVLLLRVTGFSFTYYQSWKRWHSSISQKILIIQNFHKNFKWTRMKFLLKHYEDNFKKKKKKENRKNLAGKATGSKHLLMQVLSQRCLRLLLTPKHLAKPNTFPIAFNGTDQSAKCSLSPTQLSCCQLLKERGIREGIKEQELGPFKPKRYRMRTHTQNKTWWRNSFVMRKYRAVKKHTWRTSFLSDFWRPCRSCTGTSHRHVSSAAL